MAIKRQTRAELRKFLNAFLDYETKFLQKILILGNNFLFSSMWMVYKSLASTVLSFSSLSLVLVSMLEVFFVKSQVL